MQNAEEAKNAKENLRFKKIQKNKATEAQRPRGKNLFKEIERDINHG